MELRPIQGIRLRRGVLGTLLLTGSPMTVTEIIESLRAHGLTTMPGLTCAPNRVVADLLAYQVRVGNVRKVGRATFAINPTARSISTRRRWRHWQDGLDGLDGLDKGPIR